MCARRGGGGRRGGRGLLSAALANKTSGLFSPPCWFPLFPASGAALAIPGGWKTSGNQPSSEGTQSGRRRRRRLPAIEVRGLPAAGSWGGGGGQTDSQTASQLDKAPIAQWRKGEHGSAFALGIMSSCNTWAEGGQRAKGPHWGSTDLGEVFFPCSQLLCLVAEERVPPPSSHSKASMCPPLSRLCTATRAMGLGVDSKQCCHCPSVLTGATKGGSQWWLPPRGEVCFSFPGINP